MICSLLNDETVERLNKYGYCVVDNALGATEAHALRQEIVWYVLSCYSSQCKQI